MKSLFNTSVSRRKFMAASAAAIIPSGLVLSHNSSAITQGKLTIGEVIESIKKEILANISGNTVDTIKSGDVSKPVTGIITTMFATIDVIKKTIDAGANLIIAHEPTFYNHNDETAWLAEHEVFVFKKKLLEDNNIVVWRFHDYWHSVRPDGVIHGALEKLGWTKYYKETSPFLLTMPATSLGDLVNYAKLKLGIQTLRFIGDRQQSCERILFIPGAAGGRVHITAIQQFKPDVLITGEVQEWETSEYIRDSILKGEKRSLIILGHIMSEDPGMAYLVEWLQPKFPDLKITHIGSGNPFTYA